MPASLLSYLPLILGPRLPADSLARMIADSKDEGYPLTRFGLASESPRSRRFSADEDWRGAIWAPPIAIIVDGLHAAGETELASGIARRFCSLCLKSGFAENFNALTGEGLRDPTYTWTSSIFLLLASGALCEPLLSLAKVSRDGLGKAGFIPASSSRHEAGSTGRSVNRETGPGDRHDSSVKQREGVGGRGF